MANREQLIIVVDLIGELPSTDVKLWQFALVNNIRYQFDGTTWVTGWGTSVGGDVYKVGTPANNQIGIWTGDGTLEGDTGLTFNGTNINMPGGSSNGHLQFGTTGFVGTSGGDVNLQGLSSSTDVNISAGAVSGTLTLFGNEISVNSEYTLPDVDGTSGQYLSTNGSGETSWVTVSEGGIGDMTKDVYDQTNSGVVDNAEQLGGQNPSVYDQSAHVADMNNPHSVSKANVGLSNADNTSDVDKPISTATQTALDGKVDDATLQSHLDDTNNPHSVAKSDVGLGNVDNTSDADKPVSDDTQTALDGKANLSGGNTFSGKQTHDGYTEWRVFGDVAMTRSMSSADEGAIDSFLEYYEMRRINNPEGPYLRIDRDNGHGYGVGLNLPMNTSANIDNVNGGAMAITRDYMRDNTVGSVLAAEPVGSDRVLNVVSLTQAEYDAGTPVSTTFYIITDA